MAGGMGVLLVGERNNKTGGLDFKAHMIVSLESHADPNKAQIRTVPHVSHTGSSFGVGEGFAIDISPQKFIQTMIDQNGYAQALKADRHNLTFVEQPAAAAPAAGPALSNLFPTPPR